jgi:hypothetical protein
MVEKPVNNNDDENYESLAFGIERIKKNSICRIEKNNKWMKYTTC